MKNWDKRYRAAGMGPDTRLFGDQPCDFLRQVMARPDLRREEVRVQPPLCMCLAVHG